MKTTLLLAALLLSVFTLTAQTEVFFPTQEGAILTYSAYTGKHSTPMYTAYYKVNQLAAKENGDMDISYSRELYETTKKKRLILKEDITVNRTSDTFYFDMSDFINKHEVAEDGKLPDKYLSIEGMKMAIPLNPQPGDTLPDAEIYMWQKQTINTGLPFKVKIPTVGNLKTNLFVVNRKVEAVDEEVTVKAGTFSCYKVSCDLIADVRGMANGTYIIRKKKGVAAGHRTYWYAKGIGIVKMEQLNPKGELDGGKKLIEVQNLNQIANQNE